MASGGFAPHASFDKLPFNKPALETSVGVDRNEIADAADSTLVRSLATVPPRV